jgi:hypothetical protein
MGCSASVGVGRLGSARMARCCTGSGRSSLRPGAWAPGASGASRQGGLARSARARMARSWMGRRAVARSRLRGNERRVGVGRRAAARLLLVCRDAVVGGCLVPGVSRLAGREGRRRRGRRRLPGSNRGRRLGWALVGF